MCLTIRTLLWTKISNEMVIMYLYHTVTQSKIHKNFTPLFITKLWHMLILVSEKAISPHSGTLAWKIPWTQEPGRLQSMGSLSWTWLSDFTFTFRFHALEKEMATHSSVLIWRIPATGEPGGLLSMGSHRVGHDWSDLAAAAAAVSLCIFYHKNMNKKKKLLSLATT